MVFNVKYIPETFWILWVKLYISILLYKWRKWLNNAKASYSFVMLDSNKNSKNNANSWFDWVRRKIWTVWCDWPRIRFRVLMTYQKRPVPSLNFTFYFNNLWRPIFYYCNYCEKRIAIYPQYLLTRSTPYNYCINKRQIVLCISLLTNIASRPLRRKVDQTLLIPNNRYIGTINTFAF